MQTILVLTAVVAAAMSAPPAAPVRPSARLILLPARQQHPPPAEAATPTTTTTTTPTPRRDSDNAQTEKPDDFESEKLVDAGEYYVLTPEGKLQMVKYTTNALKTPSAQPAQIQQQPEPFAQFQVEYFQYPNFEIQPSPAQVKAEKEEEESEEESGFEAKVQFRDVKPIPAPIYSYNPAPVVRILKK